MTLHLVYHPEYSFEFPHKHRFPMEKFRLLHERLQASGLATDKNTLRPGRARQSLLELAHCPEYLERFIHNKQSPQEIRRMGLPWSPALMRRTLIAPNGTFLTASLALQHGIACHLAGGTHHAHHDEASGFCILNDLAIASLGILHSQRHTHLSRPSILIFDCDVHQGDGTARILEHESRVFTCSVHCDKNFPARKASSDMDVEVARGTSDDDYLEIVRKAFLAAIDKSKPALVFYDAGVDIYANDPLGLLNVSLNGIRLRERTILEICQEKGLPVATVIGGGYDDDREALAMRHSMVVEEAFAIYGA
ncbi:histone deacetylase family protein [Pseudomaricurvus sp.]|uniref:histone deacetylase family protein n=1 Tax=Pseudomaricurvus sp. TaxID=2004510 RepID=UPI003F6AA89C